MRDFQHWLITVYFFANDEGPGFPVRYLIKTPVIVDPYEDGSENDLETMMWDEKTEVIKIFVEQFEAKIGSQATDPKFRGEVLYVEEFDGVVFEASA